MYAYKDPKWKDIKDSIRRIRGACHSMDPVKNGMGVKCFHEVDVFQNRMRKIFQERRRKRR